METDVQFWQRKATEEKLSKIETKEFVYSLLNEPSLEGVKEKIKQHLQIKD